jgi:hypothetical protein
MRCPQCSSALIVDGLEAGAWPDTRATSCPMSYCGYRGQAWEVRHHVVLPRGSSVFICPACNGATRCVELHKKPERTIALFQCQICCWRASSER